MKKHHLHLVSDSTGGTIGNVVKACLAQFEVEGEVEEHLWNLVRNDRQLKKVFDGIQAHPGPVLYTLVDEALARQLEKSCTALGVPSMAILQPVLFMFGSWFGKESRSEPGLQHQLNAEYFSRMDAVDYALHHDDGQKSSGRALDEADVILVGVSRTSKTPTCIYLANRGVKAANVPYVPGVALPEAVLTLTKPLFVGLTAAPERLVDIRRNRLKQLGQTEMTDYHDLEKVTAEVQEARKLYTRMGWPVIDVTRRSVEETAAEITKILSQRHAQEAS